MNKSGGKHLNLHRTLIMRKPSVYQYFTSIMILMREGATGLVLYFGESKWSDCVVCVVLQFYMAHLLSKGQVDGTSPPMPGVLRPQ